MKKFPRDVDHCDISHSKKLSQRWRVNHQYSLIDKFRKWNHWTRSPCPSRNFFYYRSTKIHRAGRRQSQKLGKQTSSKIENEKYGSYSRVWELPKVQLSAQNLIPGSCRRKMQAWRMTPKAYLKLRRCERKVEQLSPHYQILKPLQAWKRNALLETR